MEEGRINAWIEDGEPPLEIGRTYRFGINIGKLRQRALGNLQAIEERDEKSLGILIVVGGHGFSVEPQGQSLLLPTHGDTEAVFFAITPVRRGSLLLRITLYLARELTLLEEFEIPINAQNAIRVA